MLSNCPSLTSLLWVEVNFVKNLLVLPLSEEWSYGEKVDELNGAEEAEADAKPNAATKLSWNCLISEFELELFDLKIQPNWAEIIWAEIIRMYNLAQLSCNCLIL